MPGERDETEEWTGAAASSPTDGPTRGGTTSERLQSELAQKSSKPLQEPPRVVRRPRHDEETARMSSTTPRNGKTEVRELTPAQCLERLAGGTVGRVGYVTAQGLQIIPLNYRLAGSTLMLSTTPRSSLAQLAEMGQSVTFEADYYGPDLEFAWSVLMQGRLRELDAAGREKFAQLRRPLQSWLGDAASLHLEFVPATFSGRVLHHHWNV